MADIGTKVLNNSVITRQSATLEYENMSEYDVTCAQQVLAMFWEFGSPKKAMTDGRTCGSRHRRMTACE